MLPDELKADLLVLLSDVEGLYSGPPGEPHSKLIHTYVKERHHGEITFGDKSRVGRGGMTAKVKAAVYAAYAGTPVVITRYSLCPCYLQQYILNDVLLLMSPGKLRLLKSPAAQALARCPGEGRPEHPPNGLGGCLHLGVAQALDEPANA
ncbi:hypothetical protein BHE74_00058256 [Ensete ventricosum]|nr:hypothetical protein GW17_00058939 [Ensete ventricosum]RWW36702.1 hypothetical protein BHE74_00058256 [Ensete ventricosum]